VEILNNAHRCQQHPVSKLWKLRKDFVAHLLKLHKFFFFVQVLKVIFSALKSDSSRQLLFAEHSGIRLSEFDNVTVSFCLLRISSEQFYGLVKVGWSGGKLWSIQLAEADLPGEEVFPRDLTSQNIRIKPLRLFADVFRDNQEMLSLFARLALFSSRYCSIVRFLSTEFVPSPLKT